VGKRVLIIREAFVEYLHQISDGGAVCPRAQDREFWSSTFTASSPTGSESGAGSPQVCEITKETAKW
jgi:hypothetical protein